MKKNPNPMERPFVFLLWYGDTLELCSNKIRVCYNYVSTKLSDKYQADKKSYSQVARDINKQNYSIMLVSYTNRYKIERRRLIKKFDINELY